MLFFQKYTTYKLSKNYLNTVRVEYFDPTNQLHDVILDDFLHKVFGSPLHPDINVSCSSQKEQGEYYGLIKNSKETLKYKITRVNGMILEPLKLLDEGINPAWCKWYLVRHESCMELPGGDVYVFFVVYQGKIILKWGSISCDDAEEEDSLERSLELYQYPILWSGDERKNISSIKSLYKQYYRDTEAGQFQLELEKESLLEEFLEEKFYDPELNLSMDETFNLFFKIRFFKKLFKELNIIKLTLLGILLLIMIFMIWKW